MNVLIDLKVIISNYPRSVGTRSQLFPLLRDLYPAEKRAVNVVLAVCESGIASKIANLKALDTVQMQSFVTQLVDEYGLQEQYAIEGIEAWAKAYEVSVLKDDYTEKQSISIEACDEFMQPENYVRIEETFTGTVSNYELEQTPQGIVISKFRGFEKKKVIIPNIIDGKKVIGIGKDAYRNCKTMQTLSIADGIEYIEDGAFANCVNLTNVLLPPTLKRIGSIEQSKDLWRGENLGWLGNNRNIGAFTDTKITSILLPENLKILGDNTFSYCKKLTEIILPKQMFKIGYAAFSGCSKLCNIQFPLSLKEIGIWAFKDCSSLSEIVLNEGLTTICEGAFRDCSRLYNIYFPSTLKEIGKWAFKDCSSLSVIMLNEGLTTIGKGAFNDCKNLSKVLIPSTFKEIIDTPYIFDDALGDLFSINGWYQPSDRRMKGWRTTSKNSNLTIYCYAGSYGLEYARENGYPILDATKFYKN